MLHRLFSSESFPLRTSCALLTFVLASMLILSARLFPLVSAENPPQSPAPPEITVHQTSFSTMAPTEEAPSVQRINILLIGQDRTENETRARSDSMILCTFCPSENKLLLTSFLRDLYVEIPGYWSDRLNAAYAYGGMELLQQTMETNFGFVPDGCLEIDFSGFPKIIDLLGGVCLELREDEANAVNAVTGGTLAGGIQELNGEQALAYARIRKLDADGDFSRTARQRKVLISVIEQCRNVSSVRLMSVVLKALPMVTTDMSREQITELASELLPMLSECSIVSQHIPAEGTYSYSNVDGKNVLCADLEAARSLLDETVFTE